MRSNNAFKVEGTARNVEINKLYDFWTDYRPEDVEIMRKHGMTMALERVSRRQRNHVIVDTTARLMGRKKNMRYDILLHPEDYWLEMTITIEGFVRSHRTYRFRIVPEGTHLVIEDEYQPISLLAKMMNGLGMLRTKLVNDTTRTMQAFITEAEERFGVSSREGNGHFTSRNSISR